MQKEVKDIALTLVSLLLFLAVLFLYIFFLTRSDARARAEIDAMYQTTETAAVDKIDTYSTMSKNGESVLVSTVINSLYEMSRQSILYVRLILPTGEDICYVTENVTVTGLSSGCELNYVSQPFTYAAKKLVSYSKYMCTVTYDTYEDMPYIVISGVKEVQ